jgi:hypothetical protein
MTSEDHYPPEEKKEEKKRGKKKSGFPKSRFLGVCHQAMDGPQNGLPGPPGTRRFCLFACSVIGFANPDCRFFSACFTPRTWPSCENVCGYLRQVRGGTRH